MNLIKKTKKKIILLCGLLLSPVLILSLSRMPSSYFFAGTMYIKSSEPDLFYSMYYWSNSAQKFGIYGPSLGANKQLSILDLFGGNIHSCPNMFWNGDPSSSRIMLIPNLSFFEDSLSSKEINAANRKQFNSDLKSGRKAPYVVIERQESSINIFILGRNVPATTGVSQKISFNFLEFESLWVAPSGWYGGLGNSAGMAFGFNFDDEGKFPLDPNSHLADDAFYIWGIQEWHNQYKWTLGQNWMGLEVKSNDILTMQKLIDQGIITFQHPFIYTEELQRMINFVNSTGYANFENVQ